MKTRKEIAKTDILNDNFLNRLSYIKAMDLTSFILLSSSKEYFFEDNVCVNKWVKYLFGLYQEHELNDDISNKIVDLYAFLIFNRGKDSTVYNLLKIIKFAMKLDDSDFKKNLNIKNKILTNSVVSNWGIFSLKRMRDSVILLINAGQKKYIEKYLLQLREKLDSEINILSEKKSKAKSNSKSDISIYAYYLLPYQKRRLYELLEYSLNTQDYGLNRKAKFKDGQNIFYFFNNFVNHLHSFQSISDDVKQCFFILSQTIDNLFADNKIACNAKTNINYGPVLYRVLQYFNINDREASEKIGIPFSIFNRILSNDLYPNVDDIQKVLVFLKQLTPKFIQQQVLLEDATQRWSLLLDEVLKRNESSEYTYTILGLDNLAEYEASILVDSDILKSAKEENLDWYYKCVTYNYAVINYPSLTNLYFYDGSLIKQWYNTQCRTITGKNKLKQLSSFQLKMFKAINKMDYTFKRRRNFIADFDYSYNLFMEYYFGDEQKQAELEAEGFSVRIFYNLLSDIVKSREISLNEEQLRKIKNVYKLKLFKRRVLLGNNQLIEFSVMMMYLMRVLNLSASELERIWLIGSGTMEIYLQGRSFPRNDNLNKMIQGLERLSKQDFSPFQLNVIEEFKNYLLSAKKANNETNMKIFNLRESLREDYNFGENNDCLLDVPIEYLEDVRKEDYIWYSNWKYIADLLNNAITSTKQTSKVSYVWYLMNLDALKRGELSLSKKVLLQYLINLDSRVDISKRNNDDVNERRCAVYFRRINEIQQFVDKNGRLPFKGELILDGKADAYIFYNNIYLNSYISTYVFDLAILGPEVFESYQNLLFSLVNLRSKKGIKEDYIDENGQIYAGEHLEKMKIVFRLSSKKIALYLKIFLNTINDILENKCPLTNTSAKALKVILESSLTTELTLRQREVVIDTLTFIKNESVILELKDGESGE